MQSRLHFSGVGNALLRTYAAQRGFVRARLSIHNRNEALYCNSAGPQEEDRQHNASEVVRRTTSRRRLLPPKRASSKSQIKVQYSPSINDSDPLSFLDGPGQTIYSRQALECPDDKHVEEIFKEDQIKVHPIPVLDKLDPASALYNHELVQKEQLDSQDSISGQALGDDLDGIWSDDPSSKEPMDVCLAPIILETEHQEPLYLQDDRGRDALVERPPPIPLDVGRSASSTAAERSICRIVVRHGPLPFRRIVEIYSKQKLRGKRNMPSFSIVRPTLKATQKVKYYLDCLAREHKIEMRESGDWVASRNRIINHPVSPPELLAQYLDGIMSREKVLQMLLVESNKYASALPTILLFRMTEPRSMLWLQKSDAEEAFAMKAAQTLQKKGLPDNVDTWAWVVSAPNTDEMADRLLSLKPGEPPFLLLEVLRRRIFSVRTLKLLLIYTWDTVMGKPASTLTTLSDLEVDAKIPCSEVVQFSFKGMDTLYRPSKFEETTYEVIFIRLLHHVRRIWSPALVNLSYMVAPMMYSVCSIWSDSLQGKLDARRHQKASKMLNHMLFLFSIPVSIEPYKSMAHNWQAQKVLLELAGQFEPPLLLDQYGYRAILSVLAAQKKTEQESKAANLRARSWPPWRVDQDGMDAQRSLEDDFSRVVSAAIRAKESGYHENSRDRAIRILGGQDPDGTPTIHRRNIWNIKSRKIRPQRPNARIDRLSQSSPDWAARIVATRDVQEAWSAFLRFQELGGTPSLEMYHAMFEKLAYERARLARRQAQHEVLPGDGLEVLPPLNDNFTSFYQQSLQPMSAETLYRQMRKLPRSRPSGRFLDFLVLNARTPHEALRYLEDSLLDPRVVDFLIDIKDTDPDVLRDHLPGPTLAAFISLICRFVPRVVVATDNPKALRGAENSSDEAQAVTPQFSILKIGRNAGWSILNPLHHAIQLLTRSQTRSRAAWYALFRGLARRGAILDGNSPFSPKNDLLSWKVMAAALGDFHRSGLHLSPRGFVRICNGLEKAILASHKIFEKEDTPELESSQVSLVADEFKKMTEYIESREESRIPNLLHVIGGVHIHAYIRVLGLAKDHHRLIHVLQWMVKYHGVLGRVACLSRNGDKMIRRVLVAMRVYLDGTQYESKAEELVNSVEIWDGWPSQLEASQYISPSAGVEEAGPEDHHEGDVEDDDDENEDEGDY